MKVLKALVFDASGKTPPTIRDAIEYEGHLWLVPGWYEIPTKAVSKPVRLILLDPSKYQKIPDNSQADLVVNAGLPTQLFDQEIAQELRSNFRVVEGPDIELPAGGGRLQ